MRKEGSNREKEREKERGEREREGSVCVERERPLHCERVALR